MKIQLRKPLISDAKRYFEILSHPEFHYFPAKPKTVKEEVCFLQNVKKQAKSGLHHNFAVIVNGRHTGGAGFIINPRQPYICELGYFIDRRYWNKGIATRVVSLLEKKIAEKPDIVRIEIKMAKDNTASQKVAIKSGYKKEGLMRKHLKIGDKFYDCYLYAKILK